MYSCTGVRTGTQDERRRTYAALGPTAAGPNSARARARRRRGCTCVAETRSGTNERN
jgi:hypothetical protein